MKLSDKMYLTASEVAEMLEVSKSKAYKIIADMNANLEKMVILPLRVRYQLNIFVNMHMVQLNTFPKCNSKRGDYSGCETLTDCWRFK